GAVGEGGRGGLFGTVANHHAEALRVAYRQRRDRMLAALAATHGNLVTWRAPEGGFSSGSRFPKASTLPRCCRPRLRTASPTFPGARFSTMAAEPISCATAFPRRRRTASATACSA